MDALHDTGAAGLVNGRCGEIHPDAQRADRWMLEGRGSRHPLLSTGTVIGGAGDGCSAKPIWYYLSRYYGLTRKGGASLETPPYGVSRSLGQVQAGHDT
jgi:hypothetical protein